VLGMERRIVEFFSFEVGFVVPENFFEAVVREEMKIENYNGEVYTEIKIKKQMEIENNYGENHNEIKNSDNRMKTDIYNGEVYNEKKIKKQMEIENDYGENHNEIKNSDNRMKLENNYGENHNEIKNRQEMKIENNYGENHNEIKNRQKMKTDIINGEVYNEIKNRDHKMNFSAKINNNLIKLDDNLFKTKDYNNHDTSEYHNGIDNFGTVINSKRNNGFNAFKLIDINHNKKYIFNSSIKNTGNNFKEGNNKFFDENYDPENKKTVTNKENKRFNSILHEKKNNANIIYEIITPETNKKCKANLNKINKQETQKVDAFLYEEKYNKFYDLLINYNLNKNCNVSKITREEIIKNNRTYIEFVFLVVCWLMEKNEKNMYYIMELAWKESAKIIKDGIPNDLKFYIEDNQQVCRFLHNYLK
ncbi:hypothetical protein COBT_002513, partial [Conglomerata obtusa]